MSPAASWISPSVPVIPSQEEPSAP
jgi:hypothetical protein